MHWCGVSPIIKYHRGWGAGRRGAKIVFGVSNGGNYTFYRRLKNV